MQSKQEILIVEDDAADLYLLSRALNGVSGSTAHIRVANNGREALELLAELERQHELPDVIALDLHMPILGGIAFLRLLRKNERLRDLRTIILTSSPEPEAHVDAINAGADGVIVKPQGEAAIAEVAEHLLNFCQTSMGDHHIGTEVGAFGPYGF
jgi:CheY-like chemotaxis protein